MTLKKAPLLTLTALTTAIMASSTFAANSTLVTASSLQNNIPTEIISQKLENHYQFDNKASFKQQDMLFAYEKDHQPDRDRAKRPYS